MVDGVDFLRELGQFAFAFGRFDTAQKPGQLRGSVDRIQSVVFHGYQDVFDSFGQPPAEELDLSRLKGSRLEGWLELMERRARLLNIEQDHAFGRVALRKNPRPLVLFFPPVFVCYCRLVLNLLLRSHIESPKPLEFSDLND